MSAIATAAVLLSTALIAAPPPPRRRLRAVKSRPRIGRLAVWLVVPLIVGVAIWSSPALGLAAVLVAVVIARRRHRRSGERRRRGESRAMTAALEVLVGELRVGAHPLRAFGIAAAESTVTGSPQRAETGVGDSLRAVATRARLGADVAGGLQSAAAGSAIPAYWDRLAVCWILATEHGLAMSTLMEAAHRDIISRQRFADRVQAGLAGARATSAILAGLPLLGVALGELIGARPVQFLLGGGPGSWLLVIGVGLIVIGVTWADHIIDRLRP
ncbi:MAG: hypothetical protein WBC17_09280 [Mycobacterium sp.]|jgi:tight adherence protein B